MKHMHIIVPDELYEDLRRQSYDSQLSMSKIIIERLTRPLDKVKAFETPEYIKKEPLVPARVNPNKVEPHKSFFK